MVKRHQFNLHFYNNILCSAVKLQQFASRAARETSVLFTSTVIWTSVALLTAMHTHRERGDRGSNPNNIKGLDCGDVNHSLVLSDPYYKTIFVVIIHLA